MAAWLRLVGRRQTYYCTRFLLMDDMVVQCWGWLAGTFMCSLCMFFLCLGWFPPGFLPQSQNIIRVCVCSVSLSFPSALRLFCHPSGPAAFLVLSLGEVQGCPLCWGRTLSAGYRLHGGSWHLTWSAARPWWASTHLNTLWEEQNR